MRFLIILLLLVPSLAIAQFATELEGLKGRYQLLEQHRARLETRLGEQSKRISRLKSQPAGVRRDFQLKGALKENFELANKLTELRKQLHDLSQELEPRYDQLLEQAADPQERARIQALKEQLIAQRASGPIQIVTEERADPLDAPEDLEAKADLLQDSAEKLRRQLQQVQQQLTRLEHRAKLQRHSRALEENPFIESSPRRTGHTRRTSADRADGPAGSQPPTSAAPRPAEPAGEKDIPVGGAERIDPSSSLDGANGEMPASDPETAPPPAAPAAPGSVRHDEGGSAPTLTAGQDALIVSIQEVLDPAVLRELTASSGGGSDLKSRIASLRRAQRQLKRMAGQLGQQADKLRRQATARRQQK